MDKNFEMKSVREGAIVKGRVIRKQDGDVFVDIEYKSEGLIPKDETMKYGYYDGLKDGEEIDVFVKKTEAAEGMVLLSKIVADKKVIFSKVKKAHREKAPLEGKVVKAVKGGFIIDFGANVTAFLPMSHSKAYGEDITGKSMPFKVIQLDEEKRNVVVSYKEYVDEKAKNEEEALKKAFRLNEKVKVRITAVKENGLETEKDGVSVFIPASELSWKKDGMPAPEFTAGAEIEALVYAMEKGRVALSVKRLTENPFLKFMSSHKQGDRIKVKVKEAGRDGLTAEVEGDIEGFIPSGEISYYRRVVNAGDVYKPGDELETCLIKIDDADGKAVLSVKRLEKNPWHSIEERYPVGARVIGTTGRIDEKEGVEIELEENFDAYMHISNVSWLAFNLISDVLKPGEKKEFKILGVDKNKYRIMLGMKQLTTSPWITFAAKYKEGSSVEAKIIEIEDNAVICQVAEGITGKISIKNRNKLAHKKGDTITARIVKIEKDSKRLSLAAKDLEITEAQKQIDEYMKTHEHSFKMDDIANFGNVEKEEGK